MEVEFFLRNSFSHHKAPTKMLIKQISRTKQKQKQKIQKCVFSYSFSTAITITLWQNYPLVISTYTCVYHYREKNVPGHHYNLNPYEHIDKCCQAKFLLLCPCTLPQLSILFTSINYFWCVKYSHVSALAWGKSLFGSKRTHRTRCSSPISSAYKIIE